MDLPTVMLMIGAALSGLGSIILAWRIKAILDWVRNVVVAHEVSIRQLRKIANNEPQDEAIIEGTTSHLLSVESRLGMVLLVTGFGLLGLGMLTTAGGFMMRFLAAG